MPWMSLIQVFVFFLLLALLIKPMGLYMHYVYEKPLGRGEKVLYRLFWVDTTKEMSWQEYAKAFLLFNILGGLFVYLLLRIQAFLPLNPEHFSNVPPLLAFNTAISFFSNTNWQAYGGENTMSYLSQMMALTPQNFLSAGSGLAVFVAVSRGIQRSHSEYLGNFWIDLTRSVLYILLPLSLLLSVALVSQGVIQNFKPYQKINTLEGKEQILPMGPAASQIAIKQLGSNGGGFFNTNSAHPFENPTPLSNFLELLAIVLLPLSLCYTFGKKQNNTKQGWILAVAMLVIFIAFLSITLISEQVGNPKLSQMGLENRPMEQFTSGGNMEGKEVRFGIISSALWASATTASSNGSVNCMLDSMTPLGGGIPLMQLSDALIGGVGSGLYMMIIMVIMTVFIAGLMVGRTPEYLGKKIEPYEVKLAAFSILLIPLMVLLSTACSVLSQTALKAIGNPAEHGFSEILYAYNSMSSNNGSAFGGLNSNITLFNFLGGVLMFMGRFWIAIPSLAIAGSLARKKKIPVTIGTFHTDTPIFACLLIMIILILGGLSFLPALSLGPIVEQLILFGGQS